MTGGGVAGEECGGVITILFGDGGMSCIKQGLQR